MTTRTQPWPQDDVLASYLEGELRALEAARLEVELMHSLDARLRLEQLQEIRTTLSAALPELERVDLTSQVRTALAARTVHLERGARRWQRRSMMSFVYAAAAAACVALGVGIGARPGPAESEFRAKAALVDSAPREVRAAFQVYRVRGDGRAELLGADLTRSDGLLFAYTNAGSRPYTHLMIFGVDASGQVRWFYPAYERAGTDPVSLEIAPDQLQALLPDVIRHDYAVGELTLYALFTRSALHVSEVEAWLAKQPLVAAQPWAADSLLKPRKLEVTP